MCDLVLAQLQSIDLSGVYAETRQGTHLAGLYENTKYALLLPLVWPHIFFLQRFAFWSLSFTFL